MIIVRHAGNYSRVCISNQRACSIVSPGVNGVGRRGIKGSAIARQGNSVIQLGMKLVLLKSWKGLFLTLVELTK
jgi:hypothetical protein